MSLTRIVQGQLPELGNAEHDDAEQKEKKDRADLVEDLVFKGKSHVEDIDQREDRDHADQKKNRKKPLGRVAQFMREEIRGAVVHFFFRV